MKEGISYLFLTSLMMMCLVAHSQERSNSKIDTLRYINGGTITDTFYCEKTYRDSVTIVVESHNGCIGCSRMSYGKSIYVISDILWLKVIKSDTFNYLSVQDFERRIKTKELFSTTQGKGFYYEFEPVKKIEKDGIDFYLYNVKQMENDQLIKIDGSKTFHIIFNFKYGLIYKKQGDNMKVLKGFEKYLTYFR